MSVPLASALWYSHDPFPLTPALSLREREHRRQNIRKPEPLAVVGTRSLVLPLPEGEGRGEGERALEISDRGSFAIGSRNPKFQPMKNLANSMLQVVLLLALAPLVSGCIKNWKAKLQNRRGPRVWQPYSDTVKFLRKDMVISEHASWIFRATPYVLFSSTLLSGLLVPMLSISAPLSLFGGALAPTALQAASS